MRSLGALVLLAGFSVALFVYLPAPVDRVSSLDELRRAVSAPDVQLPPSRVTPVVRLSAFSPSIALATPPAAALTPVTTEAPPGWRTTVAVAAPAPTPAVLPRTLSPTDPDARYKLVLDIQQQLKRVGCYWGRMDGSWGIATKDAMKDFTNRVNATLPLDEPDYVQLTLIQSHAEKTCGACPAGESLSASGHCVGLPITALAKQTNAPLVATAQKEVLPWKASAPDAAGGQPLFKPMPTTVVSTEPLPGRMAIGASVTTSVDSQHSEAPVLLGAAATPPGTATAVLDPNVAAVKPAVTAAPQTERHARPESGYHRTGPGTPRYNLLLSLGGLY
jgi:hypothetical protein